MGIAGSSAVGVHDHPLRAVADDDGQAASPVEYVRSLDRG